MSAEPSSSTPRRFPRWLRGVAALGWVAIAALPVKPWIVPANDGLFLSGVLERPATQGPGPDAAMPLAAAMLGLGLLQRRWR